MKHTAAVSKPKRAVDPNVLKDFESLEGKALEAPQLTTEEDIRLGGDSLPHHDTSYTSELQYNGYDDIEDYDNNAYDLNVEKETRMDPEQELNFDGRKEDLHTEEEDPLHPQE